MYNKEFKELVKKAVKGSNLFYDFEKEKKPNPFYIGFGNPNSKILIVGQEKAIKDGDEAALDSESIQNPYQWEKIINEEITDLEYIFNKERLFKNPLHPYTGKPSKGNTWNQYQKLVELVYPEIKEEKINNSFFLKSFITEVNHEVSTTKLGNQRNIVREKFIDHNFYKQFAITILAAGDYLTNKEIEYKFDVKFHSDNSEPYKRCILFKDKNEKRILVNTRQMSNFYFDGQTKKDYFQKIVTEIKKYGG